MISSGLFAEQDARLQKKTLSSSLLRDNIFKVVSFCRNFLIAETSFCPVHSFWAESDSFLDAKKQE